MGGWEGVVGVTQNPVVGWGLPPASLPPMARYLTTLTARPASCRGAVTRGYSDSTQAVIDTLQQRCSLLGCNPGTCRWHREVLLHECLCLDSSLCLNVTPRVVIGEKRSQLGN